MNIFEVKCKVRDGIGWIWSNGFYSTQELAHKRVNELKTRLIPVHLKGLVEWKSTRNGWELTPYNIHPSYQYEIWTEIHEVDKYV